MTTVTLAIQLLAMALMLAGYSRRTQFPLARGAFWLGAGLWALGAWRQWAGV